MLKMLNIMNLNEYFYKKCRKAYDIKPNMHVGMAKKPLVPYNPTSYRNRLPTPTCVMPHKNKSVVELGDPG